MIPKIINALYKFKRLANKHKTYKIPNPRRFDWYGVCAVCTSQTDKQTWDGHNLKHTYIYKLFRTLIFKLTWRTKFGHRLGTGYGFWRSMRGFK